jgi:predicted nucleic acid-binding protein
MKPISLRWKNGFRRNKNKKIKLPDAIVIATALALGATLITRDDDLLKLQFNSFSSSTMGPP